MRADLRDIADRTNYGPRPEDRGALVLSATQDTDAAWETRDDEGKMHGAFSWAWIRAMRDSSAGETAAETFARATARLRAERPYQEPVIAGTRDVTLSPFLGIRNDRRGDRTVIAWRRVRSDGTVFLQGGWANGLTVGCELRVRSDRLVRARDDHRDARTGSQRRTRSRRTADATVHSLRRVAGSRALGRLRSAVRCASRCRA